MVYSIIQLFIISANSSVNYNPTLSAQSKIVAFVSEPILLYSVLSTPFLVDPLFEIKTFRVFENPKGLFYGYGVGTVLGASKMIGVGTSTV